MSWVVWTNFEARCRLKDNSATSAVAFLQMEKGKSPWKDGCLEVQLDDVLKVIKPKEQLSFTWKQ